VKALSTGFLSRLLPLTTMGLLACWPRVSRAAEDNPPNFAFATQLGSGIYDLSGRTIQIYRFSPAFWIRSLGDGKLGLRIRFPLTLGFYDFTISDVVQGELPDRISTMALVPSLEIPIAAEKNWFLTPFVGMGLGKDLDTGTSTYIYAVGISSLALFQPGRKDVRLGNRFVYTGYTDHHFHLVDDFSLLEAGLDVRTPTGVRVWGHEVAFSVFGANYVYVSNPQLIQQVADPLTARVNWELGFTLGTEQPWKVVGLRLPRLGLGYRFGVDGHAIRFIIGNPFPLDPPRQSGKGDAAEEG